MLLAKTIVATGASSGMGFELLKHLLTANPSPTAQPYRIIMGARDVPRTLAAFDTLHYDTARHSVTVLPLELFDLAGTREFARESLKRLAAQHYLLHLFRDKLVESKSRVIIVSSGAVSLTLTMTAESLEKDLRADTVIDLYTTYCQTKFIQLVSAHWWRRELAGKATVVAVSPGFIPGTNLVKKSGLFSEDMPGAQSIAEGRYLELALQEKWSPSKEAIEKEAGLSDWAEAPIPQAI
ncbi:hypothetical protein CHGG_08830 [Chaetomium globosum CBS 148.51]|uniref:NAD(P)-binding domain-containing protein n=1 Tax=Chaetomium globosum (strain ATCC 6205 / CBS 148.51 / DSM 1962 / NBRC 6347 / NRRL 1970) TaxID=306901 RepID=Q2GT74_CHAGB|nr:uncharacterized protein CHGG_08830 [Chaetomium globosum CBS 148.51]EAQ84816.1 hypothetical protein CHGG_08830 [Chaetomium globosum CBS 148.51]